MRQVLYVALTLMVFAAQADEPFIEISGVKIARGMPEASVLAAFTKVSCEKEATSSQWCSVGDGQPPEYDGEISFEDGRVRSAVRNLPMPEEPGEVLMLLYSALERVANADRTCAQIQLFSNDSGLKTMTIAWPDKAIWFQTHGPSPNQRGDMIKETLVPAEQESDVAWKGRCVYGN